MGRLRGRVAGHTQYAKSEGVTLAYQVISETGPTLVQIPGAISNIALEDTYPPFARYYGRLTRKFRVIRFDKRGTGLSDRSAHITTLEQQLADVRAIFDATGTDRAALCGMSHGASLALLFAVAYPERVSHLLILDGLCCDARDPFRPIDNSNRLTDWDGILRAMEDDFEGFIAMFAEMILPDATQPELAEAAEYLLATASPAAYQSIWRGMMGMDLRPMLRHITAPTLVLHARGDIPVPVAHGRYMAEHIAGAQYREFDTNTHAPWFDDGTVDDVLTAMEAFITDQTVEPGERIVANVLFTDIVDSTAQQRQRGDGSWRKLRENFEVQSRRCVEQCAGRVVSFNGDGIMAAFPTPGDALRAATALVANARDLGIEIRAGVHAGEAYQMGEALSGTCVNIASRVSAAASASEILTTEVVRGMVEGSGFSFDDHGEVDLKGIGPRRLVRLTVPSEH